MSSTEHSVIKVFLFIVAVAAIVGVVIWSIFGHNEESPKEDSRFLNAPVILSENRQGV